MGPEMKSTGEVMGTGANFGEAFQKAQKAVNVELPQSGVVFLSVRDADKGSVADLAKQLIDLGFDLVATQGTAREIEKAGLAVERVNKVKEGRPHIVDWIKNDRVNLIVNTTEGRQAIADSYEIRRTALQRKITYTTTIAAAEALCLALSLKEPGAIIKVQEITVRKRAS